MLLRLRREQLLARCSLHLTNLQIILLLQIFLGSSDETLLFFRVTIFSEHVRSALSSLLSDALFKALSE